jgi:NAD dependent epimerase/dehydratase family enzyme
MTGATGYIGKHLSSYLTEKGGHRVIPLGRSMFREGMSGLLIQTLAHCDVVINLAGAPINKRWTPEYKQELFNSRIVVTHRIVRALNAVSQNETETDDFGFRRRLLPSRSGSGRIHPYPWGRLPV